METKRDLTKELLAECFKKLLLTTPFDKITIKMITGEAGLIRPTFYKHFQDKYEVVEWIFQTDITDQVDALLEERRERDACLLFFRAIEKDRAFYRRCCMMDENPNSFLNVLTRYLHRVFMRFADTYAISIPKGGSPALTKEMAASYYSYGMVNIIEDWILKRINCSADDFADAALFLLTHSIRDVPNAFRFGQNE